VELLTVIAIISILVSLLLPAVQKARELVNRLKCQNNMRQIGIAMHSYESAKGTMPTAGESFDPTNGGAAIFDTQSTLLVLLPFIESGDVLSSYDMTQSYNATTANKAAAKTVISLYQCPTNPLRARSGLDSIGYGITDYMPIAAAAINPTTTSTNSVRLTTLGFTDLGALRVPAAPSTVIVDGLSKTIGMLEDVGRSEFFYAPRYADPVAANPPSAGWSADLLPSTDLMRNSFRWAEPASASTVGGPTGATYPYSGKILNNNAFPFGGPSTAGGQSSTCLWTTADCGPNDEPFSFHGGGVNCLFMDAHVSFIRDDIDPIALRRLLTAQEGLASSYTDY
jgi:prepilin-type processing-associated H-X9-DG protein